MLIKIPDEEYELLSMLADAVHEYMTFCHPDPMSDAAVSEAHHLYLRMEFFSRQFSNYKKKVRDRNMRAA